MARFEFGGTTADFVVSTTPFMGRDSVIAEPARVTFWSAKTGGAQHTDLLLNGTPVASIDTDAKGMIPRFQGPDGVTAMWADVGSGERLLTQLAPVDAVALAVTASTSAASSAGIAEAAAAAAKSVAEIEVPDDVVSVLIDDGESETRGALNAAIAKSVTGANASRFVRRAQSGDDLKITVLGDSMWAGQTVTNPATDGAAILLADDLSGRFGSTITVQNRAAGGRTMLTMHTFGDVAAALEDKADLYIIGGGRNDALHHFSGPGGAYRAGYTRPHSIASRERLIRMIRDRVPKADIILTTEQPYRASTGSTTNPVLATYYRDVQRLAAEYGCEFVDVFQACLDMGDYTAFDHTDGVHPNTAGHRFMADVVLDHLPFDYSGPVLTPMTPGTLATRKPGEVDTARAQFGYVVVSTGVVPQPGLSFTKSGTGWSGTSPHVTSTPGDAIEYAFAGTELHVNLNNTDGASPVVFDVAVDGVTVATGVAPSVQGIAYYHPFAVGLTPTPHTVKITLVSGTLSINQAAALLGPGSDLVGTTITHDLSGVVATQAVPSAGTPVNVVQQASVPLPAGWTAMDVDLTVRVQTRVSADTVTWREFQTVLTRTTSGDFGIVESVRDSVPPITGAVPRQATSFAYTDTARMGDQTYRLGVIASGADKTLQYVDAWSLRAVCRRIA